VPRANVVQPSNLPGQMDQEDIKDSGQEEDYGTEEEDEEEVGD